MRNKKNVFYSIITALSILIVLNIIVSFFSVRGDFTADKRFTLHSSTKKILENIKDDIIVTLYISDDLPPSVLRYVDDFKNMLIEYNNYSKHKIKFENINPSKNEELETQAIEAGIRPRPLEVREKNKIKVQKIFLGAVIQVGGKSAVIPLIKPSAMEYDLSSLIKKLTIKKKDKIAYIIGHGELEFDDISQVYSEISMFYDIVPVDLLKNSNLSSFKSVMLVSPSRKFITEEFYALDNFLLNGGSLFIAFDRVKGLLSDGVGVAVNTGLEQWLAYKGLYVDDSFTIDKKCGNVTIFQKQGYFTYNQEVSFPFLPVVTNFSDHIITDGLESVIFQFASPITYIGSNKLKYTPLAWTSSISGKMKAPISFNVNKVWRKSDFLYPNLVVASVLEGKIIGNKDSKICLVADGNFMSSNSSGKGIDIQVDNINFMVNAVEWLSDDSGLMSLRNKSITSRPLDQLSDGKIFFLRYLNFLMPLFLVVLFGLFRFERRRMKTIRRMKRGAIK